jgi:general secretion pathway protein G
MLQRIRMARENEGGFTLIELLIVIIILGILAAIVLFGLGTFRSDSKTSACKADRRNLQTAVAAYNAKFDAFPSGPAALQSAGYIEAVPTSATFTVSGTGVVSNPC